MRLTCDFFVEHRGIEPLTSGLQSLLQSQFADAAF